MGREDPDEPVAPISIGYARPGQRIPAKWPAAEVAAKELSADEIYRTCLIVALVCWTCAGLIATMLSIGSAIAATPAILFGFILFVICVCATIVNLMVTLVGTLAIARARKPRHFFALALGWSWNLFVLMTLTGTFR